MKWENVRIGVVFFRHLEIGHYRISGLGTTLAGGRKERWEGHAGSRSRNVEILPKRTLTIGI